MTNPVYNISNHLIEVLKSGPSLVNTITFEVRDRIDVNKQNIYPLVNIDMLDSTITESLTSISYLITIVEQRELGNKLMNDKIFGTNYIDNASECHLIGSRLIKSFITNRDIFLDNEPVLSFLPNTFDNGLDGVEFNLILSVTNEEDCE